MHAEQPQTYDVLILGAGGAGLMCAIEAGRRGRRVLVIDHADKLGGKILISGGGRCNFTNLGAGPAQYVSENPHFMKSALSRFIPADFIRLVEKHEIPYHEKKLGQLFCDLTARDIVALLKAECADAGVEIRLSCRIDSVTRSGSQSTTPSSVPTSVETQHHPNQVPGHLPNHLRDQSTAKFVVQTSQGAFGAASLVIATGGLSIPKIGATGFGYEIARQFGLALIPTRPALDGFVFTARDLPFFKDLAGVSVDCTMSAGGKTFRENLLFTHAGLSGPASLQASLHWSTGEAVLIDLLPDQSASEWLINKKKSGSQALVRNLLGDLIPSRLAVKICEQQEVPEIPLAQIPDRTIEKLAEAIHHWAIYPAGTVGYSKAEVTRGGVDTNELSSKTMESKKIPGLYFVGEVVDVTGWLGGYNFQWAWASGWAAGQVV